MKDLTGKFKFKVPEDSKHEDAGKSIEKTFEYVECESESEAIDYITKKEWNVTDMVNDKIKTNARSNAYQTSTLVYKPSEVSQEDIVERMVRDYVRLGFNEEVARAQVTSMLANKGQYLVTIC